MRWFLIDRFTEFVRGTRAVAVRSISFAEEQVVDCLPGYAMMPQSLIVEGVAQCGGLLVGETSGFANRVVLAKVGKAVFHRIARPGDTVRYEVNVDDIRVDGSIVSGRCYIEDELMAEVDLVFAHLDDRFKGVDLFEPAEFLRLMRNLELYKVGRTPDGEPLEIPPHMLEAEEVLRVSLSKPD